MPWTGAARTGFLDESFPNKPDLSYGYPPRARDGDLRMNFSKSRNESLLYVWESIRRQALVDRANGGRFRIVGDNVRVYAELVRAEIERRELNYTPINWAE